MCIPLAHPLSNPHSTQAGRQREECEVGAAEEQHPRAQSLRSGRIASEGTQHRVPSGCSAGAQGGTYSAGTQRVPSGYSGGCSNVLEVVHLPVHERLCIQRLVEQVTLPPGARHLRGRPVPASNTKVYSSTYLAMGFANVRAGTQERRGVFWIPARTLANTIAR